MKKLLLFCCALAVSGSLRATVPSSGFPEKSYDDLFVIEVMDNGTDLGSLYGFVKKYSEVIKSGKAPVYVTSYSNTSPVSSANSRDAAGYASRLKKDLQERGVPSSSIVAEGFSGTYDASDPIVIVRIGIPKGEGKNAGSRYKPARQDFGSGSMIIPRSAAPAEKRRSGGGGSEWSLRTNAVVWATTTINAGVEWRYDEGHSVMVNGGWAHWNWDNDFRTFRSWFVMPEYRWYLGQRRNWYVGIQGQYGKLHVMLNERGYQGEFYGGSVTGGYQLPIGRKLSLDFGLGLGFTQYKHDKYEWMNVYPVNEDTRMVTERDRKFNLYGPNFASISLVWHMNRR